MGDRRGEAYALGNLANAYARLGDGSTGSHYYEQVLVAARQIGDQRIEAATLWNASIVFYSAGNLERALQYAESSASIFEEIEDPNAAKVRKQLDIWKNG